MRKTKCESMRIARKKMQCESVCQGMDAEDCGLGLGLGLDTNNDDFQDEEEEVKIPDVVLEDLLPAPEKRNLRKMSIEGSVDHNSVHCDASPKVPPSSGCAPNYIIVDLNCLTKLVETFTCNSCEQTSLQFEVSGNYGLAHKVSLVCGTCGTEYSSNYSSERSVPNKLTDTSTRQDFDVNRRIVKSFLDIGRGYPAMEQFCLTMGMRSMCSSAFYDKCDYINAAGRKGVDLSLKQIRAKVVASYRELDPSLVGKDVIDIAVSFDGSWQTRGFSSKTGTACVVDLLTGYIVDFVVLSKFCHSCARAKKDLDIASQEYAQWKQDHAPECQANYHGSSPAMEVNAAEILWKRSEECGLRYTTLLSDGDAKTFNHLVNTKVYGPHVSLTKEECLNHVGKRLGTALRTLKKNSTVKGIALGGKSIGSLKDATILKLTQYYHNAIQGNADDVVAMKTAIFATLHHCMSTDAEPRHSKCPKGSTSWCFYERAIANGEKPGKHSVHVHNPLSTKTVNAILPVYQRMATDNLLERCKGRTQNANESIHSRIWSKCPKSVFASRFKVENAVADTVCQYNNGYIKAHEDSLAALGLTPTGNASKLALRKEKRRLYHCSKRAGIKYGKVRRKIRLAAFRAEKIKRDKEGSTYSAGAFDAEVT